jgi:hypothetical protein
MGIYMSVLLKRSVERSRMEGLGEKAIRFFDAYRRSTRAMRSGNVFPGLKILKQSKNPVIVCGTDIVPDFCRRSADQAMILKTVKERAGLFISCRAPTLWAGILPPKEGPEQIVEEIEEAR